MSKQMHISIEKSSIPLLALDEAFRTELSSIVESPTEALQATSSLADRDVREDATGVGLLTEFLNSASRGKLIEEAYAKLKERSFLDSSTRVGREEIRSTASSACLEVLQHEFKKFAEERGMEVAVASQQKENRINQTSVAIASISITHHASLVQSQSAALIIGDHVSFRSGGGGLIELFNAMQSRGCASSDLSRVPLPITAQEMRTFFAKFVETLINTAQVSSA